MGKQGVRYTKEEEENIRKVHATSKSYKSMAHLWPNREPHDVAAHAVKMRLGPRPNPIDKSGSFSLPMLIKALESHPGKAYDVAPYVGLNKEYAGRLLRSVSAEGEGQLCHIHSWLRAPNGKIWVEFWVAGPGKNAPRPIPITNRERKARERAEGRAARSNPFLIAMGAVKPSEIGTTRVFKQDMTIHLHDEMEEAA